MSEREFGGYPESCIRAGHFQLEGEQVMAIVTDLLDALAKAEGSISNASLDTARLDWLLSREWVEWYESSGAGFGIVYRINEAIEGRTFGSSYRAAIDAAMQESAK